MSWRRKALFFDMDGVLLNTTLEQAASTEIKPRLKKLFIQLYPLVGFSFLTGRISYLAKAGLGGIVPSLPFMGVESMKVIDSLMRCVYAPPRFSQRLVAKLARYVTPDVLQSVSFCGVHEDKLSSWMANHDIQRGMLMHYGRFIERSTLDIRDLLAWMASFGVIKLYLQPQKDVIPTMPAELRITRRNNGTARAYCGNVHKGVALAWIVRELTIDLRDVVIFVDGENDLELAQYVSKSGGIVVVIGDKIPDLTALANEKLNDHTVLPEFLTIQYHDILKE